MAPGPGSGQQEEKDQKQDQGDPEGIVNAKGLAVVEQVLEAVARFLAGGDGVGVAVVVDHVGDAAGREHGAQGGDEGREFELAHQSAVDHAADQAAQQRYRHGDDRVHAHGHQGGGHHGAHADHGTNGQVDVSGDQQVALPNADQQIFGHGPQQVHDILPGKYVPVNQSECHVNDNQSHECCDHRAHSAGAQQTLYGALLLLVHNHSLRFSSLAFSQIRSHISGFHSVSSPGPTLRR